MKRLIKFLSTTLLLLTLVPMTVGAVDFYVKRYSSNMGLYVWYDKNGNQEPLGNWDACKSNLKEVYKDETNDLWYKINIPNVTKGMNISFKVRKDGGDGSNDKSYTIASDIVCIDNAGSGDVNNNNIVDGTNKTFTKVNTDVKTVFYVKYHEGFVPNIHIWGSDLDDTSWPGITFTNLVEDNDGQLWYTVSYTTGLATKINFKFNQNDAQSNEFLNQVIPESRTFFLDWSGSGNATTVDNMSGTTFHAPAIDPTAYYFVITKKGEEDRWLKMSPSRVRGGGIVLNDRWSYNIQDFMVDKYKDTDGLHYYIIKGDKSRKYTPHSSNKDYELGKTSTSGSNKNCGDVKAYAYYGNLQNENNCTFKLNNKDNTYNGVSYTWLFNSNNNGNADLEILVNKTRMGQTDDPAEGYYLVGNFTGQSATAEIEPQKVDNRRSMNKYFYKNGFAYPAATAGIKEADADSVVYRVTVAKPKGAKSWGNLYLAVFRKRNITSWPENPSESQKTELWKKAIRPQEQWNYGKNNEGLDATATHGGLYMRKSDAGDTQQALNPSVSDEYESYTFSMNVTTSTYRITFNQHLYILGPAVNDGDETNGWSPESPDNQTKNAYKLVYDTDAQCYTYRGGDGKTLSDTEQPIHLVAGKPFAFAYNKNFTNTFFEENDIVPVDLRGTITTKENSNEERRAYNVNNGDSRYETQYVNFLRTGTPLNAANHDQTVNDCTFNLPTGDYYIRLYIRMSAVNPDLSQVFYTIRRKYTFTSQHEADEVSDKNTYKTFCDYHAVVLPDNVEAWYIKDADKATRTVTYTNYPLYFGDNGQRVLPAFAPVILVTNNTDANVKKPTFDFDYYSQPNFNESNLSNKPETNLLKGQVHSANVATVEGEKANFLFACQKLNATDTKPTVGFFIPGVYDCPPINLAYLQLEKDFLGGNNSMNIKAWTFVFEDEITGIDNISTDVNKSHNDNGYYTLQGVKVNAPTERGIYIHNGKKIIIK